MTHLPFVHSTPRTEQSQCMAFATKASALTALLFSGAIFGFFYAWVCSTMWGLDATDPRTAIAAMQAMNASVRNGVFAPAFFGTPIVMWIAAIMIWNTGNISAARTFALGGAVYAGGGMLLTMMVNVPMNEALAQLSVPADTETAREIWVAYSTEWQFYNGIRTVFSGVAMLFAGVGLLKL